MKQRRAHIIPFLPHSHSVLGRSVLVVMADEPFGGLEFYVDEGSGGLVEEGCISDDACSSTVMNSS